MSRFTWVKAVQMIPGQCMLCGKASDPEGFVDTQVTIDGYGQCAICYRCVVGLQTAFNLDAMAKPLITDAAVSALEAVPQAVRELKEKYDNSFDTLATSIDGLSHHFAHCAEVLHSEYDARVRAGRIPTAKVDRPAPEVPSGSPGIIEAGKDRIVESARFRKLGTDLSTDFDVLDGDAD